MEQYWNQLKGTVSTTSTGGDYTIVDDNTSTGTYYYPYPDPYGQDYPYTVIYPPYSYTVSYENKKERAYEILKVLVKEEVIKEPKSFKKFCDLIEKIAKVI